MARPKRIDLPFTLYHVMSRTNSGGLAFRDSRDHQKFLDLLARNIRLFSFRLHAYCFMPNHFHLLLESREYAMLSQLMQRQMSAYSRYFRKRHQIDGFLFQGRFKSPVVDKSGYFLEVSRYIHVNPVKSALCKDPVAYPASSLAHYVNGDEPPFLNTHEILQWFDGDREAYLQFVMDDRKAEGILPSLEQRYVGNEAFARRMKLRLGLVEKNRGRAAQARMKREELFQAVCLKKAERITQVVAEFYQLSPDVLKKGDPLWNIESRARKTLVTLILEFVPWTHRRLAQYLNLTRVQSINWNRRSADDSAGIQKDLERIRGLLDKE